MDLGVNIPDFSLVSEHILAVSCFLQGEYKDKIGWWTALLLLFLFFD